VSLSKKLFLAEGIQVPCVNLPAEVDLGDIHPWAASLPAAVELVGEGKSAAFLFFVENSTQLKNVRDELKAVRKQKIDFWICYPRKPFFGTDLSSEKTLKLTKKVGLKGRAEEAIDDRWSAIHFTGRKAK
jgi:hypothetical protein